jgi:hypothetical protein
MVSAGVGKENHFTGRPLEAVTEMPLIWNRLFEHIWPIAASREIAIHLLANALARRNIVILANVGAARGIGKGLILQGCRFLHGDTNYQMLKPSYFNGNFNGGLSNTTFVAIDEIPIGSSRDNDKLKTLTNDFVPIEKKGIDARVERIHCSVVICNNDADALVGVDPHDNRQVFVPDLTTVPVNQNPHFATYEQRQKLFDPEIIRQLGLYLLQREIPADLNDKIYKTEHYFNVIRNSTPDWELFTLENLGGSLAGQCVSLEYVREQIRIKEGLKAAPGRVKFERLVQKHPDKLCMKRFEDGRYIVFAERGEQLSAFKERCEKVRLLDAWKGA